MERQPRHSTAQRTWLHLLLKSQEGEASDFSGHIQSPTCKEGNRGSEAAASRDATAEVTRLNPMGEVELRGRMFLRRGGITYQQGARGQERPCGAPYRKL
jgi:hypothetical protein